ncbi:SPW repeat protein [Kitasatospora sp. NPDC059571]|uniref:SPW repeat protein n=1 Tax=Kitasatospora sp. NPDC059571 TaxID=3346871 RepID=UPI0036A516CC
MSTQSPTGMEHHPDIIELREHYERVTATPLAQGVEALSICAGLFLAISPWVVGFGLNPVVGAFSGLSVSNLLCGLVFAYIMAGYGSALERTHARAWAAMAIGVWTIIAPWATVGGEAVNRTIWTNVVTGAVMACLAGAAFGLTLTGASSRMGRSRR